MALVDLLVAGLWHFIPAGLERWLICTGLVAGPYLLLARGLAAKMGIKKRTYRYAE
jgi:NADH-quinone oxidoreductase subunit H